MKRKVEIFTAGCPVCEPVVALVKKTACDSCEISIHNLSDQKEEVLNKIEAYGIKRLPAVAVDGKLLGCCKNVEITKDDLVKAGIGSC